MRVVNAMIFGNATSNIHRNVRHVNNLVTQIETRKLIARPSDNPILAARSLRYRTILEETEQFLSNANAAMSWMETSEAAFMNLLYGGDSVLQGINSRLVAAISDGIHSLDDRLAMVTEMREMFDQIMLEMNQTYMGRYVFSGFFTQQPPILNRAMDGRAFEITQPVNADNIRTVLSFQNLGTDGTQPALHTAHVINLPFREKENTSFSIIDIPGFHVMEVTVMDDHAYRPPATVEDLPVAERPAGVALDTPILHFISSTGELVMHADTARAFPAFPETIDIQYLVQNPQAGQLNPMVYFNSREVAWDATANAGDGAWMPLLPETTHRFDTTDHEIRMEMTTANHVTINSLAREIVTPAMFADLLALFEFVENIRPSEELAVRAYFEAPPHELTGTNLDNEVSIFMSDEESRISSALHERFNETLRVFSAHTDVIQREHTSLGSRMNRIDMLVVRLEEEEINYTALLSANEDTPLQEALLRQAAAEAAYAAALRANAMVVQLSLVNFLR
jgi:flagellar hook-associated protein 3 FlgL